MSEKMLKIGVEVANFYIKFVLNEREMYTIAPFNAETIAFYCNNFKNVKIEAILFVERIKNKVGKEQQEISESKCRELVIEKVKEDFELYSSAMKERLAELK